jgi:putative restriction endonuclease
MLQQWLGKLQSLRVDRASKTPAPHKPLLLLAILDGVESGEIKGARLKLTPELAFRFLGYWEVVGARGRSVGRVELPFFYLRSDGILHHETHPGMDAALGSIRPRSVEALNRIISHACIPNDLFALMQDPAARKAMRHVLVNGDWFFPEEKLKLSAILGIQDLFLEPSAPALMTAINENGREGRDIRFRLRLLPIYRFSCVLCGVKILLPSGITLVEAAHIHQFSDSRNDDVTNGIALCRNHHWAFDQGLWTLGPALDVVVAKEAFLEEAPNQMPLSAHHSRQLDFSGLAAEHRPRQEYIEWHRKHRFQGHAVSL